MYLSPQLASEIARMLIAERTAAATTRSEHHRLLSERQAEKDTAKRSLRTRLFPRLENADPAVPRRRRRRVRAA